jgi:hypothetical protein
MAQLSLSRRRLLGGALAAGAAVAAADLRSAGAATPTTHPAEDPKATMTLDRAAATATAPPHADRIPSTPIGAALAPVDLAIGDPGRFSPEGLSTELIRETVEEAVLWDQHCGRETTLAVFLGHVAEATVSQAGRHQWDIHQRMVHALRDGRPVHWGDVDALTCRMVFEGAAWAGRFAASLVARAVAAGRPFDLTDAERFADWVKGAAADAGPVD